MRKFIRATLRHILLGLLVATIALPFTTLAPHTVGFLSWSWRFMLLIIGMDVYAWIKRETS